MSEERGSIGVRWVFGPFALHWKKHHWILLHMAVFKDPLPWLWNCSSWFWGFGVWMRGKVLFPGPWLMLDSHLIKTKLNFYIYIGKKSLEKPGASRKLNGYIEICVYAKKRPPLYINENENSWPASVSEQSFLYLLWFLSAFGKIFLNFTKIRKRFMHNSWFCLKKLSCRIDWRKAKALIKLQGPTGWSCPYLSGKAEILRYLWLAFELNFNLKCTHCTV